MDILEQRPKILVYPPRSSKDLTNGPIMQHYPTLDENQNPIVLNKEDYYYDESGYIQFEADQKELDIIMNDENPNENQGNLEYELTDLET